MTTTENACYHKTMMKIGVAIIFIIVQVVLASEHASRRSMDAVNTADGAGQCNRTQGHGDTKVVQQNKEIGLELGNHTPLAKTLEVEIN